MNRYLATVMCCVGAAACSTQHATEEPNSADDVTSTTYSTSEGSTTTTHDSSDGELRPASSDGLSATPSDNARTPSGADNYHYTNAPTAGPFSDKGAAPAAASTPAPSSTPTTATSDKTKTGTPPDNTKINERDRKSSAVTPFDQGEGAADLDITKRIRQAVMADKSLSFTAKNVKIITRDGKVVLRGPVNSAEERASIEAAAHKVAGGNNVESQLEVKH